MKSKTNNKKSSYYLPKVPPKKFKVKAEESVHSENEDEDVNMDPIQLGLNSANSTNAKSFTNTLYGDITGMRKDSQINFIGLEKHYSDRNQQANFLRSGESFLTEAEPSQKITETTKSLRRLTSYGAIISSTKGSNKNIPLESSSRIGTSKDEQLSDHINSHSSLASKELHGLMPKKNHYRTSIEKPEMGQYPNIIRKSSLKKKREHPLNNTTSFFPGDLGLYSPRGPQSDYDSSNQDASIKHENPIFKKGGEEEWENNNKDYDLYDVLLQNQVPRQGVLLTGGKSQSFLKKKSIAFKEEKINEKEEMKDERTLIRKKASLFYINAPNKTSHIYFQKKNKIDKKYVFAEMIVSYLNKRMENFENLKAITKRKQPINQEEKQEYFDQYKTTIHNIVGDLFVALQNKKNKKEMIKCLSKVANQIQNLGHYKLLIVFLMSYAKIMNLLKDYTNVLVLFKQASLICDTHEFLYEKMKVYRGLGLVHHNLQNYKKAKIFYVKMLQASWYLNDQNYELLAYDYLGVLAYYEGNIALARHYHERLLENDVEPPQSGNRELGVKKFVSNLENKRALRQQIRYMDYANPSSQDDDDLQLEFRSEKLEEKELKLYQPKKDKETKQYKTLEQMRILIEKGGGSRNFKPPSQLRFNKMSKNNKLTDQILKTLAPNLDVKFKVNPLSGDSEVVYEDVKKGNNSPDSLEREREREKKFRVPGNKDLNQDFKVMKYSHLNKSSVLFCHLSNLRSLNRFHNILSNTYKERADEGLVEGLIDNNTLVRIKAILENLYINSYIAFNRIEAIAKEKMLNLSQGRRVGIQAN